MKQWLFPSNNHGQSQGISESGIESFRGQPIASLAREICQNSLDAGIESKTVKIEFELFYLEHDKFPNVIEFKDILLKCKNARDDHKTQTIINNAIKVIDKEKIPFMRISDFNTHGLKGSNAKNNSDWYNLVKATGSSDKGGTKGGSYGIGKNATFVCSELRTVFYSTLDIHGLKATQGVAKLVSHSMEDPNEPDLETQGTGYYGESEKLMPIEDIMNFQDDFIRSEPGTDVYIAGYNNEFIENWEKIIIREIVGNYFYAIDQGTLEIKVGGNIINKENIDLIFKDNKFEFDVQTIAYFEVLKSNKTKWFEHEFQGLGLISTGYLFDTENSTRSMAMIRKPWMKIKDEKMNEFVSFNGILIFEGEEINKILRKMENPAHTKWEANRLESKSEIASAKAILKNIKKLISDQIREIIGDVSLEQIEIDGAADYIPMEEDEDAVAKGDVDTLQPVIKEIEIKIKTKISSTTSGKKGNEVEVEDPALGRYVDGTGTGVPEHNNGHGQDGPSGGSLESGIGEGDTLIIQPKKVDTEYIKLICINKNEKRYRVILKPSFSAQECNLIISKLDEQSSKEKIKISSAEKDNKKLTINGNKISNFYVNKEENCVIDFVAEEENYFSAEVTLHGNQL